MCSSALDLLGVVEMRQRECSPDEGKGVAHKLLTNLKEPFLVTLCADFLSAQIDAVASRESLTCHKRSGLLPCIIRFPAFFALYSTDLNVLPTVQAMLDICAERLWQIVRDGIFGRLQREAAEIHAMASAEDNHEEAQKALLNASIMVIGTPFPNMQSFYHLYFCSLFG